MLILLSTSTDQVMKTSSGITELQLTTVVPSKIAVTYTTILPTAESKMADFL